MENHWLNDPSFGITLENHQITPQYTAPDIPAASSLTSVSAVSAITSLLPFDTVLPIMTSDNGVTLPASHDPLPPAVSTQPNSVQTHMSIVVYFAPVTNTSQTVIPINMRNTMIEAANYLASRLNDPITVTIAAHGILGGLAGGAAAWDSTLPYNSFLNELEIHDPAAAKYFPTTLPTGVYNSIQVSNAEAKAWGLQSSGGYVGKMGVNVTQPFYYGSSSIIPSNEFDLFGVVLHELSHALGRDIRNGGPVTYYNTATSLTMTAYPFSAINFFRFTAPGVLQLNDNPTLASNAKAPYFSLDDGKTALATFAGAGRTDWNYLLNDPFNGYASPGYASNTLTSLDLTVLSLLGFDVNCFAAGTRILTCQGDIPVEKLQIGDELVLHGGGAAPIRWIGHRAIELARHPHPESVNPIRIKASALMDGVPRRDLILSPDHALYLDGALIPAKALINGTTIRQEARDKIHYYHIELANHSIIYAEGTPSESYLDTGNRANFSNGGAPITLHPDFAQTMREREGCAPFHESGATVEKIRERLLARSSLALTTDPAFRVRTQPDGSVALLSRSAIPGHLSPDPRDQRQLGVKITALHIGGEQIPLNHPDLRDGWHRTEPDGRWTNGHAIISAHLLNGQTPKLTIGATTQYRRKQYRRSNAA
jgi:hypothetical protein